MYSTSLRKVGGSVMLAVPPAILDMLQLETGSRVSMVIEGARLIIEPEHRPRYTMKELLAASDYSAPQPPEEREWVDSPPAGRELI